MKQGIRLTGFLLIMLVPVLAFGGIEGMASLDREALMKKVSGLQIPFIENQGQIKDKSVRFYANTFAGTVFVTDKCEIVYSLQKTEQKTKGMEQRQEMDALRDQKTISKATAIKESLQCAEQIKIKGINKSITKANYFIGSKDNWRTEIPTWKGVSLGKVFKGIELNLKAYGNNVEKLFTVYPEGKVSDIRVKTEGAKGIKVNKAGELEIATVLGTVKMTRPVAYQEIKGKRVQVAVNYAISEKSGKTYGFRVGEYDRTRPLVIDPLLASTFIGGSGRDYANAIAIDSSGNLYVAGKTHSTDYPTTEGAFDTTFNSEVSYYNGDVFISKLDSNLTSLLSSTYIGGSAYEHAYALAIDSTGDVIIAGTTSSTDYPTTDGAFDTTFNYGYDVFVSKLDSDLTSLLSSTFIGGSEDDFAYALAIDSIGNVIIAGGTWSSDYPVTEGAFDTTRDSYTDVIISKLDSDLINLLASTFIGGSRGDYASALTIDSGDVVIAGFTGSPDYPTTDGAYDAICGTDGDCNAQYNPTDGAVPADDIIVSRLDSNLSNLLASTYIGGSAYEHAYALAIDSTGNVIIAGRTVSTDYPVTDGAYDTRCNGGGDAIISRLDSNFTSLLSSTFIGGSSSDYARALAIDSTGNVIIAGETKSTDYPVTEGAYDITHNGGDYDYGPDVFISRLGGNLTSLLSSTFIGGSGDDSANALAIDSTGSVIIAGETTSPDYPTTEGAFDTTYNGESDGFISKLDSDLSEIPVVLDIKANGSDGPITISHNDTVSITVALTPESRDGDDADWFVLQNTDSGWYHYVNATKSWEPGIEVSFQGPLFEVETRDLWEGSIKGTGSYRFHFAVDMKMNGEMDMEELYFDRVIVDVAN